MAETHHDARDALFGGDGPSFGARFMAVVAATEPERQQQKQDEAFFIEVGDFPKNGANTLILHGLAQKKRTEVRFSYSRVAFAR